jgi:transcriptional regulator with XRE-family HTH domain
VEAHEIVRALKPYGVTQADIADATGVTDRAVRGWQSSGIRPERYDRLAELRDIVLLLSESLTPRGVGQWLHARSRLLGGERTRRIAEAGEGGGGSQCGGRLRRWLLRLTALADAVSAAPRLIWPADPPPARYSATPLWGCLIIWSPRSLDGQVQSCLKSSPFAAETSGFVLVSDPA